ncbi:MAG: acetate--CoA ligase family protein [Patescibacteria group bacterium]|nr:acetate--CoA ligase family protein [Patescibacteria group bacterium]
MNLNKFFDPESIAIIGATPEKNKVGYAVLFNLLRGKNRKIYPVNPTREEILGLNCYHSVLDIKDQIDLAIIIVRAEFVPSALIECGKKKISNAIVISSGFKESGEDGKKLEEKLKQICKKYKISLLGPNCLGIIDSSSDLNASFAVSKPLSGHIGFLSQSGALGSATLDWANNKGIGFSKFISLGNEAMLSELDFLEFLGNDPRTKAIFLYLEKITNGEKFIKNLKKITAKKPIVILKAGRSAKGLKAVMSHTGSLAPQDSIFEAVCKESKVITVDSLRSFFNLAKLFHIGILKPLRRLVILTNGGGPSVVATDLIDLSKSLELSEISNRARQKLKKILPPAAAINNPIDILGDALVNRYEEALKILVKEKNIDGIIVILTPQFMTEAETTAKMLISYAKQKPIIPVFIGGKSLEEAQKVFEENNLINFDFPKDAIESLDALGGIESLKTKKPIATKSDETKLKMIKLTKTIKILNGFGLNLEGQLIQKKKDLNKLFRTKKEQLLAMKIISQNIIHKTDVHGIKLNIKNLEEAEKSWDSILKSIKKNNLRAKIEGMLIQPMIKGKEVIIGMKRDSVFGPVIVFGLGGIFVEALKDVSIRITPVNQKEAIKMIQEIKGFNILKGLRNEKSVNLNKIADIIIKLSKLALTRSEIKEIDLNPVIANEKNAHIVDARFMIE